MTKKLGAVEKAVNALDDKSQAIIRMRYFERTEMDIVVKRVFLVRSAVYKRMEKAFDDMVYFIANTA